MDLILQIRQRKEQWWHQSFRLSNWKDGVVTSKIGKRLRGESVGQVQKCSVGHVSLRYLLEMLSQHGAGDNGEMSGWENLSMNLKSSPASWEDRTPWSGSLEPLDPSSNLMSLMVTNIQMAPLIPAAGHSHPSIVPPTLNREELCNKKKTAEMMVCDDQG